MKVDSAFIARWYENYESFIYKHAYMPINLDTKDIVMVLPYCDSVNKVDIKESTSRSLTVRKLLQTLS